MPQPSGRGHDIGELVEARADARLDARPDMVAFIASEVNSVWMVSSVLPPFSSKVTVMIIFLAPGSLEGVVEDDLPVGHDLEILAAERRVLLAARARHGEAPAAALAEVHLAQGQRPADRAEPFHQVLGLAPGLEQQARRRIIGAGDDDLAVGARLRLRLLA